MALAAGPHVLLVGEARVLERVFDRGHGYLRAGRVGTTAPS
jgi:hypothetical protein